MSVPEVTKEQRNNSASLYIFSMWNKHISFETERKNRISAQLYLSKPNETY